MCKGNTLVIVDVQPEAYDAARSRKAVKAIVDEVRKARNRRAGIIVVEFAPENTHRRIITALHGYVHWTIIKKKRCDGSREVLDCARKCGFNSKRFVVVGVNTNICVAETVSGLLDRRRPPYVRVVRDGCAPQNKWVWDQFDAEVLPRCKTPARRQQLRVR